MITLMESWGLTCLPGPEVLKIAQDRLFEKQCFEACGLPVAPYVQLDTFWDIPNAAKCSFPALLKTRRGGYDGKGQVEVASFEDLSKAFQSLQTEGRPEVACLLEQKIPFAYEVSVLVVQNMRGDCVTYPVVVNEHEGNILRRTIYRSDIVPPRVAEKARQAAVKIAKRLGSIGVLGVEMFVTVDGDLIVNEVATRPHNSGHWTQDGCDESQFAMHIRAICNWPLHTPRVLCSEAIMTNYLGDEVEQAARDAEKQGTFVHLYGKEPRPGRKVGHKNVIIFL